MHNLFFKVSAIDRDGNLTTHKIGRDIDNGETLQAVVPAGCWFGAQLATPHENVCLKL